MALLEEVGGAVTPDDAARQLLEGLDAGRFTILTTFPELVAEVAHRRADGIDETHWALPPWFDGDRRSSWFEAIGEQPPL
jgi:hypothetical protein